MIQNFILKEIIKIMGVTITDTDIELKKNSRINFLESRLLWLCKIHVFYIINGDEIR